jgi:hypothetical protein
LREEIDRVEESDVIDIKVIQQSAKALFVVIVDSSVECPHVGSILLIHLIHVLLIDLRGDGLWSNITI